MGLAIAHDLGDGSAPFELFFSLALIHPLPSSLRPNTEEARQDLVPPTIVPGCARYARAELHIAPGRSNTTTWPRLAAQRPTPFPRL